MTFERLLAAQLAALALAPLAACTFIGGAADATCDDFPGTLVRVEGYVTVDPGAPCPDAEDAGPLSALDCCPGMVYQDVNCGFVRSESDMVQTDYGYWQSRADSGDTATPRRDVCYYEGLFEETGACCGRPLLDGDRPVIAAVGAGSAWRAGAATDVAALSDRQRQAVGRHWLAAARMEHASIASFARVTLDLMRLGAPPALLADVHRAGLDEIEHARLCFALASAAFGRDLDPGPLAVPDLVAADREAVIEAVVREGCVGETLAALDAAARLQRATDPGVRAALTAIVADEGRHAALAWRILAWALVGDADGTLRRRVDAVFVQERAKLADAPASDDLAVPSHGVIAATAARAAMAAGFDRVIAPAWASASG